MSHEVHTEKVGTRGVTIEWWWDPAHRKWAVRTMHDTWDYGPEELELEWCKSKAERDRVIAENRRAHS